MPVLRVAAASSLAAALVPEGLVLQPTAEGVELRNDPDTAGEERASAVGSGWAVVPADLLVQVAGTGGSVSLLAAQEELRIAGGELRRGEPRVRRGGGPVVAGRFEEAVVLAGGRRIRLWSFPGDPAAGGMQRLAQALLELAGAPDRDLTLVLVPPKEGDPMVVAAGAGIMAVTGPGASWPAALQAARWRTVAQVAARVWMGDRPATGPAADAGPERWVRRALPGFLGGRAALRAGLAGDGTGEHLELLLTSLDQAGSPRHLARAGASRGESALLWQAAGPLALADADRKLGCGAGWLKPLLMAGTLPPEIAAVGGTAPAAAEIAELGPDRVRWLEGLTAQQAAALPEPIGSGAGLPRSRISWGSAVGTGRPVRPPDLVLVVWGEGGGHVENCGCVVNQSGGVARRRTAVRATRALGLPVVTIDLGGSLAPVFRGQEAPLLRRETEMYAAAQKAVGLDVWVAGIEELARGPKRMADLAARAGVHPVSATARWADGTAGDFPAWAEVPAGDHRIAVVGLTGPGRAAPRTALAVTAPEAQVAWPQEARAAVEEAVAEAARRASLVIVAGQILEPEARRLAGSGQVDLVLTIATQPVPRDAGPYRSSDGTLPTQDIPPDGFVKRGAVVHAAIQSMGLYRISLWLGDRKISALAVEEIFLDDHVAGDPELAGAIRGFYRRIAADPALRNAGSPPLASLAAERDPARSYAGSEACASCHLGETAQWMGTRHAAAMSTLRRRHRHFDPVCVPCHVVGYAATARGGYQTGSANAAEREDVGCETCHGPGSAHIAARGNPELIRGDPGPEVCARCHHGEHDPGFQGAVEERFAAVRHH